MTDPETEPVIEYTAEWSDDRRDQSWHDHEAERTGRCPQWCGEYRIRRGADAIAVDDEEVPVYTSGATNIFKYPELADSSKASELISAFEDKQELVEMIKDTVSDSGENTGIQVYIGNESPIQTMKDCSVVTASYDLGEGMKGTIGIIGPKRMDYENVVDNLKTLKVQLDNIFKKP